MTRVLITGDRNWRCPELAAAVLARLLARYGPDLVIVHGDATGVDASFRKACEELGVEHEPHPADWGLFGVRAGPRRNLEMVQSGVTFCIAVHRYLKGSKGTRGCVALCLKANIPVYLIDSDDANPRRIHEL